MRQLIRVLCLGLLVCALAAPVFAARTTRDLVFEDDDASASSEKKDGAAAGDAAGGTQTIAVKTTMLLMRAGATSTVLPSHDFKSGDRVKLVYTPSIDGYVYWMSKGSSGDYALIFPSEKAGMDNKVERNKEYTVPVKGAFKFDDKPGNEELLCILSPQAMADMEQAVAAVAKQTNEVLVAAKEECKEDSGSKRTTRDLVFDDDDSAAKKNENCVKKTAASKRTTRDLVFDDDDSGDVNMQKQTTTAGKPLVAHYVLIHK